MTNVLGIDAHDIGNPLKSGKGPLKSASAGSSRTGDGLVDIEWGGVIERATVTNENEDFTGKFVRTGATIEWSSSEAGFQFVSEPRNPARNLYSVVGHKRNGIFFHGDD